MAANAANSVPDAEGGGKRSLCGVLGSDEATNPAQGFGWEPPKDAIAPTIPDGTVPPRANEPRRPEIALIHASFSGSVIFDQYKSICHFIPRFLDFVYVLMHGSNWLIPVAHAAAVDLPACTRSTSITYYRADTVMGTLLQRLFSVVYPETLALIRLMASTNFSSNCCSLGLTQGA